jgi:hypothetical protein
MIWHLPSHGWKGYGRPGFIAPHFTTEAREQYEREVAGPQEVKFARWCRETVWPQTVNRRIREIGGRA